MPFDASTAQVYVNKPRFDSSTAQPIVNEISSFPEERGESMASKDLPELEGILGGEDKFKVAMLTPILMQTTNTKEFADILTNQFPNIGMQYSPAGEIILANNATGQKVLANKPGLSKVDLLQAVGIIGAFTPAGKAATLGTAGVKLGTKAVARRMAQGATASGLTQGAIEVIQDELGGELNADEIALASTFGGVAEAIVPAVQAIRQARMAKKTLQGAERSTDAIKQTRIAKEAVDKLEQATGQNVGLFQAQQSLLPEEILKQRILPQLEAGSRGAAEQLEKQNKEVYGAVSSLVESIGTASATEAGSENFRTMSKLALMASAEKRAAKTAGLYNKAMKEGAAVDLIDTEQLIFDILEEAPPGSAFEKVGNKLTKLIEPKAGTTPTLKQLQKAKIEMGDMIEDVGTKAVSPLLKREIAMVKKSLTDKMRKASPLFDAAETKFEQMSPAVTQLEKSIVGQISKIKDTQVKNISSRIFDPRTAQTDPKVIKNARKIIDEIDPNAWNDLLRVELNRRVSSISDLAGDTPGEMGNLPGKMRSALFGNPSQRTALLAGMDEGTRKNFLYLDKVLKRAATGRGIGSHTTPAKEALDKMKGVTGIVRDILLHPVESATGAVGQGVFDRNVKNITNIMFDTRYERQLKRLRELDIDSPEAARAFMQLFRMEDEKQ